KVTGPAAPAELVARVHCTLAAVVEREHQEAAGPREIDIGHAGRAHVARGHLGQVLGESPRGKLVGPGARALEAGRGRLVGDLVIAEGGDRRMGARHGWVLIARATSSRSGGCGRAAGTNVRR